MRNQKTYVDDDPSLGCVFFAFPRNRHLRARTWKPFMRGKVSFLFFPKHLSLLSGLLTILVLFSLLSWHSSCAGRITWTTCLFQLRHSLWEFRSCLRVTEKLNIKKTLLHKGPYYNAFGCFKHLEHLKFFCVCVCAYKPQWRKR